MELDGVATWIFEEGLAIVADDQRVTDGESEASDLIDHLVKPCDVEGDVLPEARRWRRLDQVDLL